MKFDVWHRVFILEGIYLLFWLLLKPHIELLVVSLSLFFVQFYKQSMLLFDTIN